MESRAPSPITRRGRRGKWLLMLGLSLVLADAKIAFHSRDGASGMNTSVEVSAAFSNTTSSSADFESRCQAPGVIRCLGFDSQQEIDPHILPPWGETVKRARVVTDIKTSGAGSLRFEVPPNTGADTSGSFWLNFANGFSAQFGEGQEFYIQWRQRFSPEFIPSYGGNGWKQIVIGEGDRPGVKRYSCTQLEVVVQEDYRFLGPSMYHSCGSKDGNYDPLQYWDKSLGNITVQNAVGCLYPGFSSPPCITYKPNQWMTFQVRVKVGRWYKNDRSYHHDSTIQLWVAEEGQPSKLVIDFSPERGTGYDLANGDPAAKYGKLWLLPYNTHKDPSVRHPTAYTWYDELIISRARIPDPQ